jgi:hypothetical protein
MRMYDSQFSPKFGREKAATEIEYPSSYRGCWLSGLIEDGPDRQYIGGMGSDDRDRCLSLERQSYRIPIRPRFTHQKLDRIGALHGRGRAALGRKSPSARSAGAKAG